MTGEESAESSYRRGREFYGAKQYARAFEAFTEAAAEGHPAALRRLAVMYRYGIVVPKDIDRAIEFLEKAVERGDGYAKGFLGQILMHGTSGYFLGGISRPSGVLRGLRLIGSGLCDTLLSRKSTSWED